MIALHQVNCFDDSLLIIHRPRRTEGICRKPENVCRPKGVIFGVIFLSQGTQTVRPNHRTTLLIIKRASIFIVCGMFFKLT